MKTGLFFGSFNPIHVGHMVIANYMVEFTDIEQLWFVISPQNPFKKRKTLLADHDRLDLVRKAINDDERFRESDIEFRMPRPSYTIDTLARLTERHPRSEFVLIMGSDGLGTFDQWKNAGEIITHHTRYVYPRPGFAVNPGEHRNLKVVEAPLMEISASMIRQGIRDGRNMQHFLPPAVWAHIDEMNFYR